MAEELLEEPQLPGTPSHAAEVEDQAPPGGGRSRGSLKSSRTSAEYAMEDVAEEDDDEELDFRATVRTTMVKRQSVESNKPRGSVESLPHVERQQSVAPEFWRRFSVAGLAAKDFLFPSSGRSHRGTEDEDEDDEEDEEEQHEEAVRAKAGEKVVREMVSLGPGRGRLTLVMARKTRYERALQGLGLPQEPTAESSRWLWLQHRTGLLRLRGVLQAKRLQVAEEVSPFPWTHDTVHTPRFELIVGFLVVLNSITIGWNNMYKTPDEAPNVVKTSEDLFTAIFLAEFVARVLSDSWVWIFDPMNFFDSFNIWITGVLVTWVLPRVGVNATAVRVLSALRILRLMRLTRMVRLMPQCRDLWVLVKGITECMGLLFWAVVVIAAVHYVFAVAVMEMIVRSDRFAEDEHVQERFGTMARCFFTLFQIMTFDNWGPILRPIFYAMPESIPLFLTFMGTAGIVLFNLLRAIVIKNAFDATQRDEEMKAFQLQKDHNDMMKELHEMFLDIDEDSSGTLSREEFIHVLDDVRFVQKLTQLDIDLEELPEMFEILDDGDGCITTEEFCMGILRMTGKAQSRHVMMSTQRMFAAADEFQELLAKMQGFALETCDEIESMLVSSREQIVEAQVVSAEVLRKFNEVGLRRVLKASVSSLQAHAEPELDMMLRKESADDGVLRAPEVLRLGGERVVVRQKPLPASWVLKHKAHPQNPVKASNLMASKPLAAASLYGHDEQALVQMLQSVPQEFGSTWRNLAIKVERPLPLLTMRRAAGKGLEGSPAPPSVQTVPRVLAGPRPQLPARSAAPAESRAQSAPPAGGNAVSTPPVANEEDAELGYS